MHKSIPGNEYNLHCNIESSSEEEALGALVDKLNMAQKCAPAAQKTECIRGCIKSSVTSRVREGILLF